MDEALCADKLQTAMLYTQIEAAWELHCVCTKSMQSVVVYIYRFFKTRITALWLYANQQDAYYIPVCPDLTFDLSDVFT